MHSDVRNLTAIRVVVVTTLLIGSLIIQYTVAQFLPINYVYVTAGLTYALTLIYIGLAQVIHSRRTILMIQIGGDLVIESFLVYFTGGLDSPFSFLYLVSIITASMLLQRRGGILAASGAVILYGVLGDLLFYNLLPLPEESWFLPSPWSSSRLYLNMATNFAGFYATALLTSYIAEKLQKTAEELDVNRQNLAELQAINQNVVESIPSGLVTLTQYGTLSFINPAGCHILQVVPLSVLGHHITELPFFDPAEWGEVRDDLKRGVIVRRENPDFPVSDGVRCIGYALTPLRTIEGGSYGYTLIFQDLTDMKKLESELRLKDRMAAVGELSAGIAHEIRNPLAAIAGSVQVLKSSASLSPQEQRLMSIVLKESERLNKAIAEFLRFVRPQEHVPTEFDIAVTLNETMDLLANSSELNPNHRLRPETHPRALLLTGDATQIRKVFWNFARNAMQAMPQGGTLTVRTVAAEDEYQIQFADSGHGMNEASLRALFTPFRTNFPSGTGLGMAISYRIVQDHGGRIDVDSKEGVGTTITVTLPVPNFILSEAKDLRLHRDAAAQ